MKRVMAMLLALLCLLSLAACGSGSEATDPEKAKKAETLLAARYPGMTRMPREEDYRNPGSGELSEEYYTDLQVWQEELEAWRALTAEEEKVLEPWIRAGVRQILPGKEGENRAFSPLNLYLALAMLAEVTDGESRQQILDLLGSEDLEALRRSAETVWRTSYQDDGQTASLLASSLWMNQDLDYERETLERLAEDYRASSFRGEMGSEAYDELLRTWINEQTGGLLQDQASGLHMDARTVLSLVTTLYFKAAWRESFSEDSTESGVFYSPDREETAEFMHRREVCGYYWGEHFSAVGLEMENGGTMWLLLPEEGMSPETLSADEEAMAFLLLTRKSNWEKQNRLLVNLAVPKFDLSSDLELENDLRTLGVTDVFDGGAADFSPLIRNAEQIAVSQIKHAARVKIDEEGCEAAAYTEIQIKNTAVMPFDEELDFVLDRPFLFSITNGAGLPLFVGVVNHPTGG